MVERIEALHGCRVEEGGRLRDAMQALERGRLQIALICDPLGRLVGTITDGDLRRALLGGATLDEPLARFVSRQFVSVTPATSRAQVLDLMQARVISQIPIVDPAGCPIGMHLLHQMLGGIERPNWAVIMAGGRGQRLGQLTESVPKPMLRVAGRPILERIVLHLVGFGVRRIFISVNYLSEVIEAHFGDGQAFGCQLEYLREEKPLGTGGALSLLPERPSEPLLVLNGDLITQFDVGQFLAFHALGCHAVTVGVSEHTYTVPLGVVELDGERVVGLREKPVMSWRTNAGIYAISPPLLDRVPRDTAFALPALLLDCLERRESVGAFEIAGDWIDVGRSRELQRARGAERG